MSTVALFLIPVAVALASFRRTKDGPQTDVPVALIIGFAAFGLIVWALMFYLTLFDQRTC